MRDALIESARTAFAREGYEGAGLKEISALASATTGAVYHHFPAGKEGLLLAVVEQVFAEAEAAAAAVSGAGVGRLESRIEGVFGVLSTSEGRVTVMAGAHVLGERWQKRWGDLWSAVLDVELAALGATGMLRVMPETARVLVRGAVREGIEATARDRARLTREMMAALVRDR